MKKELTYVIRFAIDREFTTEIKTRLEELSKTLGNANDLDFSERCYKTKSMRNAESFMEEICKFMDENKIFELNVHCF